MIVVSNTTAQTIRPGQAITFDSVVLQSGCAESHRGKSSSVTLRRVGVYEVHFTGNIGAATTAGAVRLAVQMDGDTLQETTMISTPAAVNTFANVSSATIVRNCDCSNNLITVVNTGTLPVAVAPNSGLFVKRVG